jgi:sec-independent protein translocase protein TatC
LRAFFVAAALVFGGALTWVFKAQIFELLLAPAGGALSPPGFGGLPVYSSPQDGLFVTVDIVKKGAFLAATPVATVSLFTLVRPAIPRRLRWPLIFVLFSAYVLFATGVSFTYFVMLSTALGFLLNFGNEFGVHLITASAYIDLVWGLMFWMGLVFQIPLLMFLLARLELVSFQRFRKNQKIVLAATPIFGALLTPGFDPFTAMLVAVPLAGLYESGLFLSWLARPDADNYLPARKFGHACTWVLRRPAVAWHALTSAPSRIWGRLTR